MSGRYKPNGRGRSSRRSAGGAETPRSSKRLRGALLALVVAAAGLVATGPGASAITFSSCALQGKSYTWTGLDDGHSWSKADNWSPHGTPGAQDSVSIVGGQGHQVGVDGTPGAVCNVTLGDNATLNTGGGLSVSSSFSWSENHDGSYLQGPLTVGGAATLSSSSPNGLKYDTATAGTPAALTANGTLSVADNTLIDEIGGGAASIRVNGIAQVGKATIDSNTGSAGDDNSKLVVQGTLQLTGDVTGPGLDVNLVTNGPNTAGTLDLNGHSMNLTGLSYSRWSGGTRVYSSSSPGTVHFSNLGELLVDGAAKIDDGATVSMEGNSVITDGTELNGVAGQPAGSPGLLKGRGTLDWKNGLLTHSITLDQGFRTILDSTGTRDVDSTGHLDNRGVISQRQGTLRVLGSPGQIENEGQLYACPGTMLTRNTSNGISLVNDKGATLAIADPSSPDCSGNATAVPVGLTVVNNGDISLPTGREMDFTGAIENVLHDGGTVTGGGTLKVGDGAVMGVVGTTTLRQGATLLLDGGEVHGGLITKNASYGGVLDAHSATGGGTFRFRKGTLTGTLLTDNDLLMDVVNGGASTTRSLDVSGSDPSSLLTLASPTHITNTTMTLQPNFNVTVSGPMTLSGQNAGIDRNSSNVQQVYVDTPGSVNVGSGATGVIDAPLENVGNLSVDGGTLATRFGYGQTGNGATTISNGGTLTTDDGNGNLSDVKLDGGSLRGNGKLAGNLSSTGATVTPSQDDNTPGKLAVTGDYTQGGGAHLRMHVAGTLPAQHDTLAVSGQAQLGGGLAAITSNGYSPTVPTHVADVVTANAVNGDFSHFDSIGTPYGTAWTHGVNANSVFLDLVYNPQPTTTTANAPGSVPSGSSVPVTVNVAPVNPTGTVTVTENGAPRGSAALSGGSATVSVSGLPTGTHTLVASYSGDARHQPSTSAPITVQVFAPQVASGPKINGGGGGAVTVSRDGSFTVHGATVTCGASDCTVNETFTATGGAHGAVNPTRKRKRKQVKLGASAFAVHAASTAPIHGKLSKSGLATLKRAKKMRVKILIRVAANGQPTTTKTITVTLKAPRQRKKRH